MLGKRSTCKLSIIVETLTSNEKESESETSIGESSDDSSDKCDVLFYRSKTLQKRISKSNQNLIYQLGMQCTCSKI